MLIGRCAWHRLYFRYPRLLGVVSWGGGLTVRFTDGMCRRCARRARAQWKGAAPEPEARRSFWESGPVGAGMVGLPVIAAILLFAGPLHDGTRSAMPPAPPAVAAPPVHSPAVECECPAPKMARAVPALVPARLATPAFPARRPAPAERPAPPARLASHLPPGGHDTQAP